MAPDLNPALDLKNKQFRGRIFPSVRQCMFTFWDFVCLFCFYHHIIALAYTELLVGQSLAGILKIVSALHCQSLSWAFTLWLIFFFQYRTLI